MNIKNLMPLKKGIGVILCGLISSLSVFSQTNDTTYINLIQKRKAINETSTKNVIKTDILTLFDGEFQPVWEHRFTDRVGFEVGAGLLMPYSLTTKYLGFTENMDHNSLISKIANLTIYNNAAFDNNKFGYSFLIEPKYYFKTKEKFITLRSSGSIGTFYRFRSYSDLLINEIGLSCSYIPNIFSFLTSPTIALSYTIQTPLSPGSEYKFFGDQKTTLNRYGLPDCTSVRLYMRLNIGQTLK
ncbi:MAG: hypothetical protein PHR62_08510 [Paludibacter sp.]|nr:hypothetical protein [Paludibacter sp.]